MIRKTLLRSTVSFSNDAELAGILMFARGPATLISSTIIHHNVKSRSDKRLYQEVYPNGEPMKTSLEYVYLSAASYEALVRSRQVKEGRDATFEAQPLTWGEFCSDPSLGTSQVCLTHKGQFYIRYYIKLQANSKYGIRLYHFSDGTPMKDRERDLLFSEFVPPKQSDEQVADRQEVEDPILPRTVKASGIIGIRTGGETYVRLGFEKTCTFVRSNWDDDPPPLY